MCHADIGSNDYEIGKLLNLCSDVFPMRHEAAVKHLIHGRFPACKALGMEPAKQRHGKLLPACAGQAKGKETR
jgi:hypothetical protein